MNNINKYQTLIIGFAIGMGLLLGQSQIIREYAHYLITPCLILLLFGIFLTIPLKNLMKSFSHKKFFISTIGINFIWTPIFAYFLGYFFLKAEPLLWIGFVMLMVTPCTDWYLIFTKIAQGNTTLAVSILPVNLILQIVLLPVYIFIFFGKSTVVDIGLLVKSVVFVLGLPFIGAQIMKWVLEKNAPTKKVKQLLFSFFENSQIIFLALAIMAMFASQATYLIKHATVMLLLFVPVMIFFIINFLVGRFVSYSLHFNAEDAVSLNLTTLARNSPISLAIAITAFPKEPFIALALVMAPLIELPVLAVIAQILLRINKRYKNG